jgi:phosphoglycerate dehydrogenase-like enzyme
VAWRVLITSAAIPATGARAVALLREADCDVTVTEPRKVSQAADLRQHLIGVDATLAGPEPYNAAVLDSPEAATLKIISRWGVGYDAVDLAAATRHGVVVANTPGLLNEAVADYTFALLLALARRVHEVHAIVRQGGWQTMWGSDVAGKTLGVIGCGSIGSAVARRAQGFGMKLLGYDTAPGSQRTEFHFVPLKQLLAESDFVSIHAALTPQNRGLIGEAQLQGMKRTAYLINTARGPLVDEAALLRALHDGTIAGAALDVFVEEPLPATHPLRIAPNVLLSPHQSSFGRETGERVGMAAAQAIVDLMNGHRPVSVVNADVLESSALRAKLPSNCIP